MGTADVIVVFAAAVLTGGLWWFFFGPKRARRAELRAAPRRSEVT